MVNQGLIIGIKRDDNFYSKLEGIGFERREEYWTHKDVPQLRLTHEISLEQKLGYTRVIIVEDTKNQLFQDWEITKIFREINVAFPESNYWTQDARGRHIDRTPQGLHNFLMQLPA